MRSFKTEAGYVVRLDVDEEIMETLLEFVRAEKIVGGSISGIGAVKDTTLGYFDLHQRQYDRHEFPDDMELVSFNGNITWFEDEPMIHAHAVLAGPELAALGGHLFCSRIAVTGEFHLVTNERRIDRTRNEQTKLNLIGD